MNSQEWGPAVPAPRGHLLPACPPSDAVSQLRCSEPSREQAPNILQPCLFQVRETICFCSYNSYALVVSLALHDNIVAPSPVLSTGDRLFVLWSFLQVSHLRRATQVNGRGRDRPQGRLRSSPGCFPREAGTAGVCSSPGSSCQRVFAEWPEVVIVTKHS